MQVHSFWSVHAAVHCKTNGDCFAAQAEPSCTIVIVGWFASRVGLHTPDTISACPLNWRWMGRISGPEDGPIGTGLDVIPGMNVESEPR